MWIVWTTAVQRQELNPQLLNYSTPSKKLSQIRIFIIYWRCWGWIREDAEPVDGVSWPQDPLPPGCYRRNAASALPGLWPLQLGVCVAGRAHSWRCCVSARQNKLTKTLLRTAAGQQLCLTANQMYYRMRFLLKLRSLGKSICCYCALYTLLLHSNCNCMLYSF